MIASLHCHGVALCSIPIMLANTLSNIEKDWQLFFTALLVLPASIKQLLMADAYGVGVHSTRILSVSACSLKAPLS